MQENSAELKTLREFIDTERLRHQQELARLNRDMEEMKLALARTRAYADDLKVSDKLLLAKYMELNEKVKKLSQINVVNGK